MAREIGVRFTTANRWANRWLLPYTVALKPIEINGGRMIEPLRLLLPEERGDIRKHAGRTVAAVPEGLPFTIVDDKCLLVPPVKVFGG